MRLAAEHGLIQMGNAPALRNIEVKKTGKPFGRLRGHPVSPCAEGAEQFPFPVERKVPVHHPGNADCGNRREQYAVTILNLTLQVGIAGPESRDRVVYVVGPDSAPELIFPFEGAGSDRLVLPVNEYGLDPCGSQFDAENGFIQIDHSDITPVVEFSQRNVFTCRQAVRRDGGKRAWWGGAGACRKTLPVYRLFLTKKLTEGISQFERAREGSGSREQFAPCVVGVLDYRVPRGVADSDNISLQILLEIVGGSVVLEPRDTPCRAIKEVESVGGSARDGFLENPGSVEQIGVRSRVPGVRVNLGGADPVRVVREVQTAALVQSYLL